MFKLRNNAFSGHWVPLPLRLIIGFGFMAHGWAKLSRGPSGFAKLLAQIGAPLPEATAWASTFVELLGGLAIFVGAFVEVVSIPLIVMMLVAMFTVHLKYGFSSVNTIGLTADGPRFGPPGYEVNLLYIAGLVSLILGGAGALSVDRPSRAKRRCRCVPTSTSRPPDPIRRASSWVMIPLDFPSSQHPFFLEQGHGRISHASDSQDGVRRAGSARHPGDPGAGTQGRPRGDRGQGVRPQPRRAAHAQGGVGRDRRRQRHRVRRRRQVLPRRRVRPRDQGGGPDGRAGPDDQRQLRRVHPRPRDERGGHRVGPLVGRPGAIPETYATAWTCLFRNLEIAPGQTLVIRGATSSFGQAALNMAVNAGARVIATSRSRDRFPMLQELGAVRAEVEGPDLSKRIAEAGKIDAVLDLVGNSTILDSLAMLPAGAAAPAWPGGWAASRRSPTSTRWRSAQRRLPDLLRQLRVREAGLPPVGRAAAGDRGRRGGGPLPAKPTRVSLRGDQEAHRVMESNEAKGKMVVVLD